jgi:hypothetical protein
MHFPPFTKSLLAAGVFLLATVAARSCGGYGSIQPWTAKLPGTVQHAVVHGNKLYAVTIQGNLIAVDLRKETVRDLGSFGLKLTGQLAMCDQAVCVASTDQLHLIDPAEGKLVRSLKCGQTIQTFGVLDSRRLYVQGNKTFVILDREGSATTCTAGQAGSPAQGQPLYVQAATLDPSGKQVLALMSRPKSGLGIIDPETGKLTETVLASAWPGFGHPSQALAMGDRMYVADGMLSYGIWINHFGYVDLKTRKYHEIKAPQRASALCRLVPGPAGSLYLTGENCVYRIDTNDKATTFRAGLSKQSSLLAVWRGNAVSVQGGNRLVVGPLELVQAAAK